MEQIIRQCYDTQNWQLLVQMFQTKTQFAQIQYAIGQEDFYQFVRCFQIIKYEISQGLFQLFTGNLYYFPNGGLMVKKNQKQNDSKNKRNLNNRKGVYYSQTKPYNSATPIVKGQYTSIQELLSCQTKPTGFYYCTQQSNTILKLTQTKIPVKICQKIRTYYSDKLKFIDRIKLFEQIPKNIIQQNLPKFNFTKIGFNQIIYSQNIRPSNIFLLVKGQAVIETGIKLQGIIIKAPNLLADQKTFKSEQARCLTQFCILYTIDKQDIERMFRKKAQMDSKQYSGISQTDQGFLRSNYFQKFSNIAQIQSRFSTTASQQQNIRISKQQILNTTSRKNKLRKNQLAEDDKKDRIKQLFSNSINQKYAEYSQKAQKNLTAFRQTPVLYELKSLTPYSPNYKQIQERLKNIRLQKILHPKQIIKRSSSTQSILMNLSKQMHTNDHKDANIKDAIDNKILQKLQMKIAADINRKYGIRKMKIL